ncbi:MAG: S8 family peptidase [Bacteroidia bacterium]
MKYILFCLSLFYFSFSNAAILNLENDDSISFFVVLKKDITLNKSYSEIINNFNFTNPEILINKQFVGSKNDTLIRTYYISGEINDVNNFNNQYADDIDFVELFQYGVNAAAYDPSDYLWTTNQSNSQGDLWHLKRIETDKAWDISKGKSSVRIATIDTYFDLNHPDLLGQFYTNIDPYDYLAFNGCGVSDHGTTAASFIAAKTDGGGLLAGIGFNCLLVGYKGWVGNYLDRAHHASLVLNVDVITSSAGDWRCNSPSLIEKIAVKEILDNGTVIVFPAGNGKDNGFNCGNGNGGYLPLYPFHPDYDSRIIIVSSTDDQDNHYFFNGNPGAGMVGEWTHSHFPQVDVCSPGYLTHGALCSTGSNPYYWACHGTSFSTPIVAGLAGLIKSVNPCLSAGDVEEIIKSTADVIADASSYSGLVGTGRINAFKALQLAIVYKPLFIQNITYPATLFTSIIEDNTILIGRSVNGNAASGDVIFSSGCGIDVKARSLIEIKPGFTANSGSQFSFTIDPDFSTCGK